MIIYIYIYIYVYILKKSINKEIKRIFCLVFCFPASVSWEASGSEGSVSQEDVWRGTKGSWSGSCMSSCEEKPRCKFHFIWFHFAPEHIKLRLWQSWSGDSPTCRPINDGSCKKRGRHEKWSYRQQNISETFPVSWQSVVQDEFVHTSTPPKSSLPHAVKILSLRDVKNRNSRFCEGRALTLRRVFHLFVNDCWIVFLERMPNLLYCCTGCRLRFKQLRKRRSRSKHRGSTCFFRCLDLQHFYTVSILWSLWLWGSIEIPKLPR